LLLGFSDSITDFVELLLASFAAIISLSASLVLFSMVDFKPSAKLFSLFCTSTGTLKQKIINN